MHRRSVVAVLVLTASVLLSGCFTYTTDTNKVVGRSDGYLVFYYRHATDDVVDALHYGLHGADERKTLSFMLGFAKSSAFKSRLAQAGASLGDFDYFFHRDNDDDFEGAARDVRGTQRCLAMDRSISPWVSDRHNWTHRTTSDRHCAWGKHYY